MSLTTAKLVCDFTGPPWNWTESAQKEASKEKYYDNF